MVRPETDATFPRAAAVVLRHEKGFVDDPADPGGATNWGISLRFLRAHGYDVDGDGDIDLDDVRAITPEKAISIYRDRFWVPHRYADLPATAAIKIFDLAVNMGPAPAARCLQRALRAVSGEPIADDGVIGPVTIGHAWSCSPVSLQAALRSEAAGHYRWLVARTPELGKFLRGWLNRAYDPEV